MSIGKWIALITAFLLASFAGSGELQAQQEATTEAQAGWIGISYRAGQGDAAARVYVEAVYRDSPAYRAGIRPGDEIVLWNGRTDVEQAMRERRVQPGEGVEVTIHREGDAPRKLSLTAVERRTDMIRLERQNGREVVVIRPGASRRALGIAADSLAVRAENLHERLQLLLRDSLGPRLREFESRIPQIRIEIERMEDGLPSIEGDAMIVGLGLRSIAGAEFAELNEGLGDYFGTREGIVVLRVSPNTPAARAGLQAGDVVVSVNGQIISTIPALRRAVAGAQTNGTRRVPVQILRRGQRSDVELRWE